MNCVARLDGRSTHHLFDPAQGKIPIQGAAATCLSALSPATTVYKM